MSNRSGKILRLVWLVNGIIVLLSFFVIAIGLITMGITTLISNREGAYITPTQNSDVSKPRAVRFTQPVSIYGTKTQFVRVNPGSGYYNADEPMAKDSNRYVAYYNDPTINVAFLDGTGNGHLLFDKPVLILQIKYPNPREALESNPYQKWIAYQVVTKDTSGNSKLGREDRIDLFVTDLDGLGLKRVLDDSFTTVSVEAFGTGAKILIYALELSGDQRVTEENLRELAFVYDPVTTQCKPYELLNKLVDKAAHIVGK